ncbi:hypothetical protein N7527_010672 [Penicillium freii]|uniref:Uncharacterized protein n=1 Tax=Penicillium freii TaxID=48697 RepID=A0A117NT72_PENFR|nr:hypothetical protein N7527_010672 [Penicillium freii]KUM66986.1 hypothetical protein ACN42_g73 [Penicillium freii]
MVLVLHVACLYDQPKIVQALLEAGADLNAKDARGRTPLYVAATSRSNITAALKFAKQVVRMPDEVDINSQDSQGRTPLWGCVAINQYDMTRLLLAQERLDPNLGPTDNFPLLLAVRLNQQLTVEHLLESKRLDVNKQTSTGQTALLEAIDVGNKDVIKMLARAGANPDIGMSKGKTARQHMLAAGIRVKWKTRSL